MDKKRKDSNARMAQYLKEGKRKQTLQTHFQLEERKARFFSILQDNENWTVDSYKKKYDITVSYKKYEVTRYYKKGIIFCQSPFYVWRIQTVVKISMSKFKTLMESFDVEKPKDPKFKVFKCVANEDNRYVFYL